MNIYDVPELQQYLYPQVNQRSTQLIDPTMLFPQRSPLLGPSETLSAPDRGLIPQIPNYFDFDMPLEGIVNTTAANQVVEDDDYESIQPLPDDQVNKSGIAKLFEFLQKFSPSSMVMGGLNALGSMLDFKGSPRYMPATIGVGGYTADQLNKMNALGGYYSEPMRAYRRNVNRISNLMRRAAADKSYSQKNLDRLMSQVGMSDVDTRGMIDSIKASADLGYGKGGGRDFDSAKDYSSSPGAIAGDMEYGEE